MVLPALAGSALLCPIEAEAQQLQEIRLHVIALSDDSNTAATATTVTPAQICTNLSNANPVYAPAGLRFVFDQATDWETRSSTALMNSVNRSVVSWWNLPNQIADQHPGKLVIFLGVSPSGNAHAYPPDSAGILDPRPGQALPTDNVKYLAYYNRAGNVAPNANISTFPHELGHYLGLFHTFPSWGSLSVAQATTAVQTYGASGVDGDLLSDTPADPGTATTDSVYGGPPARCANDGDVVVAGVTLSPDRHNIMSYYGCPPYHLSNEQIDAIKATLAGPDRNHLISGAFFGDDFALANRQFCSASGDKLYTGDFNGDGRGDLLCNGANGTMSVDLSNTNGDFWSSDWSLANRNYCIQSGEKLYVGDFNGDGRTDLLCNQSDGDMLIDYADANGHFDGSNWIYNDRNYCVTSGEKLYVGDFNGDLRADLLCNQSDGDMLIDYADANGHFDGSNWIYNDRNFCVQSWEKLYVGRFNADSRADLVCIQTDGDMLVELADASGHFDSSDWTRSGRNFCHGSSDVVYVGDFNGDGREDLLCNSANGDMSVDLSNTDGRFWSADWTFPGRNFCDVAGGQMVIGDFDNDGGADLACTSTTGSLGVDRVELRAPQSVDCITTL
ncbi:FG-GAP-like repeat-containing protein [Sorangium sp. So ce1000]|uniref:FG-GAP-like repeat-containing protein n=1 Tax=Sorangium sp. So ce1000 TaxID=3133325 RepID=UPI003F5FA6FC